MSEVSDVVTEEISQQVDVADLIGGGDGIDDIDGGEIGASIGRSYGEQFGRQLGAAVGRNVHEAISDGIDRERSLSDIAVAVKRAILTAVQDVFDEGPIREQISSVVDSITDDSNGNIRPTFFEDEESDDQADDIDEPEDAVEEGVAEDESSSEEVTATAAETESEHEDESTPSIEDVGEMRRETLVDFLGILSYDDLQSVAKSVGVKANLSREEMTEQIVDAVDNPESEGDSKSDSDPETETETETEGESDES